MSEVTSDLFSSVAPGQIRMNTKQRQQELRDGAGRDRRARLNKKKKTRGWAEGEIKVLSCLKETKREACGALEQENSPLSRIQLGWVPCVALSASALISRLERKRRTEERGGA